MSVVSGAAAGRWAIAAVVTVVVASAPAAYARLPTAESSLRPAQLLAQARHSTRVAHSGLAESRGNLGLPDLPRLGEVAALLGGTTRARVWWRSPQHFRVDRITTTGESGVYAIPGGVQTWDFETGRIERAVGASPVRLPRVDDLLPPQAARRLLAGVTARDRLVALPAHRVAGRSADGLRVFPADPASTVGRLDVYVDERTGLPLSLVVVPRGSTVPALSTAFVDVSFGKPPAADLRPRTPPFSTVRTTGTPDLATAVDRFAPFALPEQLAGLPRTADLVGSFGGTATYGRGLARFVVLPLPSRLGGPALDAATRGGATPLELGTGAAAVLVATPLLDAVVARTSPRGGDGVRLRDRWYLVAGTVDGPTLRQARARSCCRPTAVPVTGAAAAGTPVIRTRGADQAVRPGAARSTASTSTSREGDVYGFLGANGSGKTTTVRMLLGLVLRHLRRRSSCSASRMPRPARDGAAPRSARWSRARRRTGTCPAGRTSRCSTPPGPAGPRRDPAGPGRRGARAGRPRRRRPAGRCRAYSLGMRQRLGLAARAAAHARGCWCSTSRPTAWTRRASARSATCCSS